MSIFLKTGFGFEQIKRKKKKINYYSKTKKGGQEKTQRQKIKETDQSQTGMK